MQASERHVRHTNDELVAPEEGAAGLASRLQYESEKSRREKHTGEGKRGEKNISIQNKVHVNRGIRERREMHVFYLQNV